VSFSREGGLPAALEACNATGACRKRTVAMCPPYQATGREEHSTRGRATLLRAAFEGRLDGGLANDALHRALDMCLGCKACTSECPAGVDMARLKVEALAQRHRTHGVPLMIRAIARTHALLRMGSLAPPVANLAARLARPALGFRPPRVRSAWRPHPRSGTGPEVVVLADTFTRFLHPESGDAAVAALEACGTRVTVVDAGDCGRPAHAEGRVDLARRQLLRSLDRLAPHGRTATSGRSARLTLSRNSSRRWAIRRPTAARAAAGAPARSCTATTCPSYVASPPRPLTRSRRRGSRAA